jgi:hypothetical protein
MVKSLNWPLISVVILNFNGKKFLEKCLISVFNSDYSNFEVILVDNYSDDESIEIAEKSFSKYSNFKIIRNYKNLGFAEGNNVGARVAKGKYVIFLNNDTEVDSEWLKELVIVMESNDTIGAAQSKLLLFDRKTIDSTGDFINSIGQGWMRGKDEEDQGQYDKVDEIFSARGAGMIVKNQILQKIGYFDSDFFMVCEDVDLCWRIRLNGYKIVFIYKSVIYHFGSGTRKQIERSFQSQYYNSKNNLIMLIKNYDLRDVIIYVPQYIIFQLIFFLFSIPFPAKWEYNLSRIKAIIECIVNFKSIWKKRINVQYKIRTVPDKQIKKYMIRLNVLLLIVWNLFYKNSLDYNHFINKLVLINNKWIYKKIGDD